jgi:hypothetical protein
MIRKNENNNLNGNDNDKWKIIKRDPSDYS